jgi:serine phosphatase RsbU (regulator of sigma subunit)
MSQLRQHTLPDTDMRSPAQVLTTLNRLFQMDEQAGLYFTMWYGVYDAKTRRLDFAAAGQHAALMVPSDRAHAVAVGNRNTVIGAIPDVIYSEATVDVPPGSTIYLFSDGVFEIIDTTGQQWSIANLERVILEPPNADMGETQRVFHSVRQAAVPGPLEDDFSLVVAQFD